jgi:hypothetical protein
MSFYQTGLDRKASLVPALVLATSFGFGKVDFRLVVDALIAFGLVILPLVGMIVLMFLLGSADLSTAVPDALDGTGMLILPP